MDIRNKLRKISKKDPDAFYAAVTLAVSDEVADEFEDFIKDLELDRKDKEFILLGMLERKYENFNNDEEELYKFLQKVFIIYGKLDKELKRRGFKCRQKRR
jgi:hypothetical protein